MSRPERVQVSGQAPSEPLDQGRPPGQAPLAPEARILDSTVPLSGEGGALLAGGSQSILQDSKDDSYGNQRSGDIPRRSKGRSILVG